MHVLKELLAAQEGEVAHLRFLFKNFSVIRDRSSLSACVWSCDPMPFVRVELAILWLLVQIGPRV